MGCSRHVMVICLMVVFVLAVVFGGSGARIQVVFETPAPKGPSSSSADPSSPDAVAVLPTPKTTKKATVTTVTTTSAKPGGTDGDDVVEDTPTTTTKKPSTKGDTEVTDRTAASNAATTHPTLVSKNSKSNSQPAVWMWRKLGQQRSSDEWAEVEAGKAAAGVPQRALVSAHNQLISSTQAASLSTPTLVKKSSGGGVLIPVEPINTKLRIKVSQIGLMPLLGQIEKLYKDVNFTMPAETNIENEGGGDANSGGGGASPYCDYPMPNRIFIDAGARSYDRKSSSVAHFQRMYPHAHTFRCIALELLQLQQTYPASVKDSFRGHSAIAHTLQAPHCSAASSTSAGKAVKKGPSVEGGEDDQEQQQEEVTSLTSTSKVSSVVQFPKDAYPGYQYIQKAAWSHNEGVMITGMKMAKVSDDSEQVTPDPETGKMPTAAPVQKGQKTKWVAPSVNLAELIYKEVGVLPMHKTYASHTDMMADVRKAEEKGIPRRFKTGSKSSPPSSVAPKTGVRTSDIFSQSLMGHRAHGAGGGGGDGVVQLPSSFVVLKIDIEGGEWRLLPYLIQTGIIPHYIDEILLECHALDPEIYSKIGFGNVPIECVDQTNDLRAMGVYAHRWI